LIRRALNSALDQSYRDFEIVVVDDASTDDTEEVVKSINDEKIRYIRHEKNSGLAKTRNAGIAVAKGAYVAFLDDDDEWLPDKLEKQMQRFRACPDKVGIIYCGVDMVSEKTGRVVGTMNPTVRGDAHVHTLRYVVVGGGSTPLIRKECFQKAGFFDEDLSYLEDWDMWMRLSKYYEFDFVSGILVRRFIHGYQMTTIPEGKIQAREMIFKKHYDELSGYPMIFADHLNRLGILHCYAGNVKKAQRCFIRSIKKRPIQRFAYLHLLPLLLYPMKHLRTLENDIKSKSIDGVPLYW